MNHSWFLCCGNLPPPFHSFTGSLSHRAKVEFEGMSSRRWIIHLDDIRANKSKKKKKRKKDMEQGIKSTGKIQTDFMLVNLSVAGLIMLLKSCALEHTTDS